jgi:hypothetical protein
MITRFDPVRDEAFLLINNIFNVDRPARSGPARIAGVRSGPRVGKRQKMKKSGSKIKKSKTCKAKGTNAKERARKSDDLSPVDVKVETWDGPSGARVAFLLAHGAGGKSNSPQMIRYRELLTNFGMVIQFDYPGQYSAMCCYPLDDHLF